MKIYMIPSVEIALWEQENDVLTTSYGVENDNNYEDRDDWYN